MNVLKRCLLFVLVLIATNTIAQNSVEQWGRFESTLQFHSNGNPYADVSLTATFSNGDTAITVEGFYDGDDRYRIRFMPFKQGVWTYKTSSNAKALHQRTGRFECVAPTAGNHGPVQVAQTFHFSYADGRVYYPVGTTSYAWNHMGSVLQQQTLTALQQSGFNKVRMCIFPKNYDLVVEEPELYPYVSVAATDPSKKAWDLGSFNPAFFQRLEQQIEALQRLGIEADLILFHPYDKGRWGFDAMSNDVNIRYLKYVMARLGSFRNVWWSVANEWDLVKPKTQDDWVLFTKTIALTDPYKHMLSIHGSTAKYFEYSMPEISHVSVQDEGPVMHASSSYILRNVYHKPVIYDEVGYEGNLKHRWGRYSAAEMTHLIWNGIIGGTYVTHGETYSLHGKNTDTIFWAKGGPWHGESWKRAAFMRQILEQGPGPIEPADVSRDARTATAGNGYYLIYFGKEIPDVWTFNLPAKNGHFTAPKAGTRFSVDIIDTWDMEITPCKEIFTLSDVQDYRFYDNAMKKIRLPMKPYLLLRIKQLNN